VGGGGGGGPAPFPRLAPPSPQSSSPDEQKPSTPTSSSPFAFHTSSSGGSSGGGSRRSTTSSSSPSPASSLPGPFKGAGVRGSPNISVSSRLQLMKMVKGKDTLSPTPTKVHTIGDKNTVLSADKKETSSTNIDKSATVKNTKKETGGESATIAIPIVLKKTGTETELGIKITKSPKHINVGDLFKLAGKGLETVASNPNPNPSNPNPHRINETLAIMKENITETIIVTKTGEIGVGITNSQHISVPKPAVADVVAKILPTPHRINIMDLFKRTQATTSPDTVLATETSEGPESLEGDFETNTDKPVSALPTPLVVAIPQAIRPGDSTSSSSLASALNKAKQHLAKQSSSMSKQSS
jgi:hypothetical protein